VCRSKSEAGNPGHGQAGSERLRLLGEFASITDVAEKPTDVLQRRAAGLTSDIATLRSISEDKPSLPLATVANTLLNQPVQKSSLVVPSAAILSTVEMSLDTLAHACASAEDDGEGSKPAITRARQQLSCSGKFP
jgi:hypothetical protein